jgi:uncharacterized protein YukE
METDKRVQRVRLEAKLKQLEADLKDMNVSPSSQKVADAIDDVRDEIKDVKAELAALKEGTYGYTAGEAHQRHVVAVKEALDKISQLVEQKYASAAAPSWGSAGDLSHVARELDNIIEFLSSSNGDLKEGWKSNLAGAALAASMALGGAGAAHAQPQDNSSTRGAPVAASVDYTKSGPVTTDSKGNKLEYGIPVNSSGHFKLPAVDLPADEAEQQLAAYNRWKSDFVRRWPTASFNPDGSVNKSQNPNGRREGGFLIGKTAQ